MVRLRCGHDALRGQVSDIPPYAGSGGQPFSTFKFIQDIMYVKLPTPVLVSIVDSMDVRP